MFDKIENCLFGKQKKIDHSVLVVQYTNDTMTVIKASQMFILSLLMKYIEYSILQSIAVAELD